MSWVGVCGRLLLCPLVLDVCWHAPGVGKLGDDTCPDRKCRMTLHTQSLLACPRLLARGAARPPRFWGMILDRSSESFPGPKEVVELRSASVDQVVYRRFQECWLSLTV